MNIIVCIKQVLARDWPFQIDAGGTWVREQDASFEMNEPDSYALEAALRLKETHGGEVTVCSMGPARVTQVIREGLARGADRAIHVVSDDTARLDAFGVAQALADAIKVEDASLVLTGLQSDDHGFAQTGIILSALLGLPHATIVMDIEVSDDAVRVKRELEGGWFQWVTLPMPALLTIQSGINQLRYATLKGIMAAKKKEIRVVEAASATDSRQRIVALYPPEKEKQTCFVAGPPPEIAKTLVRLLRDEARAF